MLAWLRSLDCVLRGQATSVAALKANELDVPVWGLCVLIDVMGLFYGLCMGVFDLASAGPQAWQQTVSCMFKVPALFLLTLLVTAPSLYVFNTMVGSRLTFRSMVRLMVAALAVMLAVLSSIGPIVAFFSFTTTSHAFMILLNVLIFAVAGSMGMAFLIQSLHRMTIFQTFVEPQLETPMPLDEAEIPFKEPAIGPLEKMPDQRVGPNVRNIFQIWVVVYGIVGMQMAWVLSPFLGNPHHPFILFRPTGSNFFQGVWDCVMTLTKS